jgi:hypothetical protein
LSELLHFFIDGRKFYIACCNCPTLPSRVGMTEPR